MKGRIPYIEVMDYRGALEYVYCNSGNPEKSKYAIISIQEATNGYGLGLAFQKGGNCLAALNIEFSDCTPIIKTERDTLMKKEDAQKIHDFVENIPKEVELLIIHCKYGQSRSVAIADAILDAKSGIKSEKYENEKNALNRYVYYTMLETYGMPNLYWDIWYEKEKRSFKIRELSSEERENLKKLEQILLIKS